MQYLDKQEVGKRIKNKRVENNLTQIQLAEKLFYVTERQLQRIESGETACSVDKLMELAQILDTSTDYLLFGEVTVHLMISRENRMWMNGKGIGYSLFLNDLLDLVRNYLG